MKRKSNKSRRPAKSKRPSKSRSKARSKQYDPFVYGEWIILDKGKVDTTPRPTTLDLKKICEEFGYPYPPPGVKKPG